MVNGSETVVEIFNPQGIYPSCAVVCENIAYSVLSGIPILLRKLPPANTNWWEFNKPTELLFGAFLLTRKCFPSFSFHPLPIATLHFKNTNISAALKSAEDVIVNERKLPCLYNPYTAKKDNFESMAYIKELRASDSYVDLFHAPQIPFSELIENLRQRYNIPKRQIKPCFVANIYQILSSNSRLVHIAIHYFVNAARLIHEHFIEDAGLNLNLVLEAIIEDFGDLESISDKLQVIEKLRDTIKLPNNHMEFLEELYFARNEFLAHIDKDMFTEFENINDPDRYCYQHYESVSWLIRRYIKN